MITFCNKFRPTLKLPQIRLKFVIAAENHVIDVLLFDLSICEGEGGVSSKVKTNKLFGWINGEEWL